MGWTDNAGREIEKAQCARRDSIKKLGCLNPYGQPSLVWSVGVMKRLSLWSTVQSSVEGDISDISRCEVPF